MSVRSRTWWSPISSSLDKVIMTARASAVVTSVFLALLGWLIIETQGGSLLGLAERLNSSVEICWPFVIALILWRSTARAAL